MKKAEEVRADLVSKVLQQGRVTLLLLVLLLAESTRRERRKKRKRKRVK